MKKRLFETIIEGDKYFTQGSSSYQAATALSKRLNRAVSASTLREVKPLYKYLCWYVSYSTTQYIYIVAKSAAQAWYYYCEKGYVRIRDHMNKREVLAVKGEPLPHNTKLKEGDIIYGE